MNHTIRTPIWPQRLRYTCFVFFPPFDYVNKSSRLSAHGVGKLVPGLTYIFKNDSTRSARC